MLAVILLIVALHVGGSWGVYAVIFVVWLWEDRRRRIEAAKIDYVYRVVVETYEARNPQPAQETTKWQPIRDWLSKRQSRRQPRHTRERSK